jgi:hypothetical protein
MDKQKDNWAFANSFDHFRDIELESMGILYLLDFRREALEFWDEANTILRLEATEIQHSIHKGLRNFGRCNMYQPARRAIQETRG